jgi:hypothetical protein
MKVTQVRVPEHVFVALCQTASLTGGLEMDQLMCAAAASFRSLDEDAQQRLVRDYWLGGGVEPRPGTSKPCWKDNVYALVRRALSALRQAVAS